MDRIFRDSFTAQWKKYFNNAELPIVFMYNDNPGDATVAEPATKRSCIICELKKVRSGKSIAFNKEAISCFGGKRFTGFTNTIRPNFEYFLSCGIENQMEGERYIRNPQLVKKFLKDHIETPATGRYIIFKRWDLLNDSDNPEVVVFFATPDVLSGLFTMSNFDRAQPDSSIAPFGAGCSSIVHYPLVEKLSDNPRAVIGMFDISARPCVGENTLSFALPLERFEQIVGYMDESFLITDSWKIVQKRIK